MALGLGIFYIQCSLGLSAASDVKPVKPDAKAWDHVKAIANRFRDTHRKPGTGRNRIEGTTNKHVSMSYLTYMMTHDDMLSEQIKIPNVLF